MTEAIDVPQNRTYPNAAIVAVLATFPDGTSALGSGVMVGPNDVLTASHVVWSPDHGGAATSVSVAPGCDAGDAPFGIYAGATWGYYSVPYTTDTMSQLNSQYDVAVIGLSQRVGDQTGWFGIDPNGTSGYYELSGYPGAFDNSRGQRVMTEDYGYAQTDSHYWLYDLVNMSTLAGESGGPLWYLDHAGGAYVVGVVSTDYVTDLHLTASQVEAWMSDNDSLISTGAGVRATNMLGLLHGFDTDDRLFGHEGADTIQAGGGNNTVVGGNDSADGTDFITAGGGNDLIWGNGGYDTILAGDGNNSVIGGFDADSLVTGSGNDIVFGNEGNDVLDTGGGNDLIFGGQGNDAVGGGSGNDTLYGNEGNDILTGGAGADRYVFAANSGADAIVGFSFAGGDRIDLTGQSYTRGTNTYGDTVLFLSGGGSIDLNGIASSSFQAGFVL